VSKTEKSLLGHSALLPSQNKMLQSEGAPIEIGGFNIFAVERHHLGEHDHSFT
jgi:hypothetical protein